MQLYFQGDVQECLAGIEILAPDYGYELNPGGLRVLVEQKSGSPIVVSKEGSTAQITYSEKIHFFRALGLLVEALTTPCVTAAQEALAEFRIVEEPQFSMNGAMYDVSQSNAVMRVSTIKDLLKRMAMMGLNMLMIYTEESYEVAEEPYFGYMRGKYAQAELQECDRFASLFGIEMIPCIQTLAHLYEVLKWPVYASMRDDDTTLAVGNEKVYEFIEHMITSAAACFRTRRIHIGMDEAWWGGTFAQKHSQQSKFEVMNQHLARVLALVEKHGLQPMIWSDMYFRAASSWGSYYDLNAPIPPDVIAATPKGVQLVYWDYYHHDADFYHEYIKRHRQFGSEPIFAGGIWNWVSFAVNWGQTLRTTNAGLGACKDEGVREVFATIWGDNGTECNWYATLLGLQLFAEHGYARNLDMDKFKQRFKFCTGGNYDDFASIKYLDEIPGVKPENLETCNASKFLMWQDILTGLFDKHIDGLPLAQHFTQLTETFQAAISRNGSYGFLFDYLVKVSHVLALKSEMGLVLTRAYKAGNKDELARLAQGELPELARRVKALHNCHRMQWLTINKALGWDILDMRYGSLEARIESAIIEINAYVAGQLDKLEELEEERLYYNGQPGLVRYANFYDRIVSPSRIAAHG